MVAQAAVVEEVAEVVEDLGLDMSLEERGDHVAAMDRGGLVHDELDLDMASFAALALDLAAWEEVADHEYSRADHTGLAVVVED